MNIIEYENPEGVIVQLGGQTAIKLVNQLSRMGVRIFGTRAECDAAEDRERRTIPWRGRHSRPKAGLSLHSIRH